MLEFPYITADILRNIQKFNEITKPYRNLVQQIRSQNEAIKTISEFKKISESFIDMDLSMYKIITKNTSSISAANAFLNNFSNPILSGISLSVVKSLTGNSSISAVNQIANSFKHSKLACVNGLYLNYNAISSVITHSQPFKIAESYRSLIHQNMNFRFEVESEYVVQNPYEYKNNWRNFVKFIHESKERTKKYFLKILSAREHSPFETINCNSQEFIEEKRPRGPPQTIKKGSEIVLEYVGIYIYDLIEFLISSYIGKIANSIYPDHEFLISFIIFNVFCVLKYAEKNINNNFKNDK